MSANHPFDLPLKDTLLVWIDHQLHGVIRDNWRGTRTYDQYTLPVD